MVFSQDHDQVGDRAYRRSDAAEARPLAAFLTLLSPFVPMLFMGEEYGEPAPFQFFSDHIDRRIATATRDGRRQEFAAFAQFDQEIPDPQAVETFERSKLTRRGDPAIARLYAELLQARRELPPGDPEMIEFDEQSRWLLVGRGRFELACNFSQEPVRLRSRGEQIRLATHQGPRVLDGYVELDPLSGALIR